MKENHLLVTKTARYFTLGELNEHTKQVWFVLHGFGQMAATFLKQFEPLVRKDIFFVAPEALNHFYLKGSAGNVGATWMTKEDRLNEIKDYINYLNELYESLELEQFPETKITALGFSQGASTITRWANATPHRVDNVIVYAGEVGAEVFPLHQHSPLRRSNNYFIYGTRDEFFPHEVFLKMKTAYAEMNFTEIEFEGGHEIEPEILQGLML
ncbi:MAG: alpha/beta fold hydrolase [Chitinophagales bacterium]|nr:alpha/beta fold hydrolase [Chitinophagales bacterium]